MAGYEDMVGDIGNDPEKDHRWSVCGGRLCWVSPHVVRRFSLCVLIQPGSSFETNIWPSDLPALTSCQFQDKYKIPYSSWWGPTHHGSDVPFFLPSAVPHALHSPHALFPEGLNFSPPCSLCPFPPWVLRGCFYLWPDALPSLHTVPPVLSSNVISAVQVKSPRDYRLLASHAFPLRTSLSHICIW